MAVLTKSKEFKQASACDASATKEEDADARGGHGPDGGRAARRARAADAARLSTRAANRPAPGAPGQAPQRADPDAGRPGPANRGSYGGARDGPVSGETAARAGGSARRGGERTTRRR